MARRILILTVIQAVAMVFLLLSGVSHVRAQRKSRLPARTPASPPSVRITPAALNLQTAAELLNELDPNLTAGWQQVDVTDGHQDHGSPFSLLLESPVHDLLRDRGLITIEPGPSGRAIVKFTSNGEKLFFDDPHPPWAISHLPTPAMTANGDYRRRVTIMIARPTLIRVRSIDETVSDKMEKGYWFTYLWKYSKTELGRDLNPDEEEFVDGIGLVYRDGRWRESYERPPSGRDSVASKDARASSKITSESITFGCAYKGWNNASIDITRTPLSLAFLIPQGDCWTPWLDLHSRYADMIFKPDGEVAIEALDYVGTTSLLAPSAASFSGNNRDWYAIRLKNKTNRTITIRFNRGGWP